MCSRVRFGAVGRSWGGWSGEGGVGYVRVDGGGEERNLGSGEERMRWIGWLVVLAACLMVAGEEEKRPAPSITIEGVVDGEMAEVAGGMTRVFFESYPRLLERFENPGKPAPRRIRLEFWEGVRVPAYCSGDRVVVSVDWLRRNPGDLGMLTHELTHAVQAYPPGGPGWLVEGIADYARKVYGPTEQPNWELPGKLTERQSYRDGYRVTGRFLEWLEEEHPGTVDKAHRQLQAGVFEAEGFREWTGKDLDTLWKECVAALSGEEGKR